MTKRTIALGCLAIVVIPVAWFAFSPASSDAVEQQPEAPPLPVETITAESVDSYETARAYTGVIRARRDTVLSFERLGTLEKINVDEGQRVGQGEVVAELDTRRLQVARQRLESRRNEAAAMLAELVAGPRQETIDAAVASVENLQAQLELEKANLIRRKSLLAQEIIPREEYDASKFGGPSPVHFSPAINP